VRGKPLFDTIVCLPVTEWASLPHNSRYLMNEAELAAARRSFAAERSWAARFDAIEDELARILPNE
jgi:hypothetical protein